MFNFIEFEKQFKVNKREGQKVNNKSYNIILGQSGVMLSAPHAVKHIRDGKIKKSDLYTGSLALYIQKSTNCHLIYKTYCDDDDPNFSEQSPYKTALTKHIKKYDVKYLIDLHGAKHSHMFNVDIGTDNDDNINFNEKVKEVFAEVFKKHKLDRIYFNHTFVADKNTICNYLNTKTNIITVQLEINSKLRRGNTNRSLLAGAVIEIITKLNELT